MSLSGVSSGVVAASHYVPDTTFPAVGLTAPIVSTMGILPLQDGGALVSSTTGFSFGDGQASTSLLRLGSIGMVVNRQFAGSSAASIASASNGDHPAWVQLGSGNVLAALVTSGSSSTTSLVQIALDGTIDPSRILTVSAPASGGAVIAGLWRLADGSVIVAGQFSAIGGHATRNLAHLSAAGSVDLAYTCHLPVSGPFGVGSDGAVVCVNPAPSDLITGRFSLARLDASATVTDTWILPAWPGSPFVALEASGNVLMAGSPGALVSSRMLYRFTRGTPNPAVLLSDDSSESFSDHFAGVFALADGSILLLGGPKGLYSTQTPGLIHLSASGAVDTSFSVSGLNGEVVQRISRGPNSWFIASASASAAGQRWREFSGDFATQLAFDPDLRTGASASAAVTLPDHSILWQGNFETPSRTVQPFVRSGPDGTLDYAHVPLTAEAASSRIAAVGSDGSIYLAAASAPSALGRAELERYRSDGSWDTAFGRPALTGKNSSLGSVAIDAQGRALLWGTAGGASFSTGSPVAQRLLPNGAIDSSFTAIEPNLINASFLSGVPRLDSSGYLLLDSQGNLARVDFSGTGAGVACQVQGAGGLFAVGADLFVAGSFLTVLGSASPNLQRLRSDGLPDATWHSGLISENAPSQVQALPEGRVLAVGFTSAVLTAEGAIDLNDPIAMGVRPVATGDGTLTTLGPDGVIRRFTLEALPAMSLQADATDYQAGDPLTLTVSASGQISGAVVWRHNGAVVAGITGNQLTVGSLTSADGGWYTAGVPTANGVVYTAAWVQVAPYSARIANASALVYFADTQQSLITGSVLQGTSAEPALFRVVGPSLAAFGIADPAQGVGLDFYGNGVPLVNFPLIYTFPRYIGSEPLVNTLLLAGAFPVFGLEIQLQLTLNSGVDYTTISTAFQPGTALFELYLPEPAVAKTGRKLINFSCRSTVGSGNRILVLGFTIEGSRPLSVLVRGIGPALQAFGVASPLSAPLLQLYSSPNALLGSNDHWQNQANAAEITAAVASTQAFPLAPGSADAALLLTLPPGAYSAVLSPEGSPGQGMIELYEVGQPN